MSAAWIELSEVSKRYATRNVLEHVSLTISAGQTTALIGPSGGGKSTLLRIINGLVGFDRGSVRVGPHRLEPSLGGGPARGAVRQLRQSIGMVFQDFQLFPHLSAIENVMLGPIRVLGCGRAAAEKRALELLERVGLDGHARQFPAQLSGGQKQRVAIARALAMQPQGLLCDEITSALDPELKVEVLGVLDQLRSERLTLLLVTHEIGFARRAADRVVVLADGRVVEEGTAAEVLDAPRQPRTREFLRHVLA